MKTDPMRTLPKTTGPLADLKKTEPMWPPPRLSANGAVRAAAEALHEEAASRNAESGSGEAGAARSADAQDVAGHQEDGAVSPTSAGAARSRW